MGKKRGDRERSPVPLSQLQTQGTTPVLRVQSVNGNRDFPCIVHSDSLSLNLKGQVKRERERES